MKQGQAKQSLTAQPEKLEKNNINFSGSIPLCVSVLDMESN